MALRIEAFDVDVTVRRGTKSRGIATLDENIISRLAASPSQRAGAADNGHGAAAVTTDHAAGNGASVDRGPAATNGVRNGVPQPELTSGTPRFIAPPLAAPEPKPLSQPAVAPAPPSFAPASFTPLFKRMPAAQASTPAAAPRQPMRSTGADGGRPLDENTRQQMESFFGGSLADVRVHADTNAAQVAANMGAEALTIGRDIYFGEGKFDPSSQSGKALLGHELTHVLQQRTLDPRRQGMTRGSVDALEMEAQTLARRFQTGAADVKGTGFLVTRYLCTYSVNRPATDDETRRLEALSRRALKACEEMLRARHPDLLEGAARALETVEVDIDTSLSGHSDEDIVQLWGHRMAAAIAAKVSDQSTPTLAAAAGTVLKQPAKGKGQQPGTTNITVTTETFDIEAENLDGAAAALQNLDEWGKTRWNVTFDYDTTDGVATSVAVTARIKVELPRWTSLNKQPRRVQAEWNRMLTALRQHENEHVRIARERIQKLAGEMSGKPESELPDIHARCLEELDTLSDAFDTRTDHGQKEGVSLDLNVAAQPRLTGFIAASEAAEAEARAVEEALAAGGSHGPGLHTVTDGAIQRKEDATPGPAVTPVTQVKHTFTIPDKKLGGPKDLGYAQAQFKIGGNVDLEITPLQASTAPGAEAGGVTLKGSGGVNVGDGSKYQAEVTAEFDKRVGGILDGCTPKAKVGGEAGGGGAKLGLEISLEGQRFEPKFGFTVIDINKEDGIKFATLEAAVDWKIKEYPYKASDGAEIKVTPKLTPKLAIEPNYKRILQALLEQGVEGAVTLTIDAALLAGPPLLAGIVVAQGIYMAGEKGELHKKILEGAVDARQAAMSYAQVMTGSDQQGLGPRCTVAVAKAKQQMSEIATRSKVTVEALMAELRKNAARDFPRIHAQARQEVFSAYYGEVRNVIRKWRKEHYILAFWTEEADDVNAANKQVEVVFAH